MSPTERVILADGNRIGVGNIAYRYDGLDRPADIFNGGPSNPLAAFGYAADGGVKWVGNIWSTSVTAATRLERDGAGRLSRVTQEMAGLASNQTDFLYNPASQIVSRSTGNRAYLWTPPHEVSRTYAPNGLNQYASTSGTSGTSYVYDLNGNLRSDGVTTFVYDAENRLVSASGTAPGARNAVLSYDPLGRLWRVWDPTTATTTATRFFYDGDRLVYETSDTGAPRHYYVHGNGADQPLVWWDFTGNNVRRFLHSDQQGSIVAVSRGDTGAAVAINSYDAWGVPGASNAALRFGYTGQAWIPELGLWYYKARLYSAALGRFLQVDPIGYEDQINLYAYAANDPVDGRDPSGTKVIYGDDDDGKRLKLLTADVAKKDPQLAAHLRSLESSKHAIRVEFEPDGSRTPGHTRADSSDALKPGKGSGSTVYIPRTGGKVDGLAYTQRDVVAHDLLGHAYDNDRGNAKDNSTRVGNLENEASAVKVENIYRGAAHERLRDVPAVPTGLMRGFLCVFGLLC